MLLQSEVQATCDEARRWWDDKEDDCAVALMLAQVESELKKDAYKAIQCAPC